MTTLTGSSYLFAEQVMVAAKNCAPRWKSCPGGAVEERTDRRTDEQTNTRTNGQTSGRTDERHNRHTNKQLVDRRSEPGFSIP